MSRIRIARKDVSWTYGSLVLSSGVNLLLLPLILWALRPEEVGLWYVYTALGGLALALDFGLTTTLSRHVTYAWCGVSVLERRGYSSAPAGSSPNYGLLSSLVATARWTYVCIGGVALILASTLGTLHVMSVAGVRSLLSGDLASWWIYVLAIWINLSLAYWNPLLRGVGAIAESGQAIVAGKVCQLVLTAGALLLGFGLVGVAVSFLLSGFVFRVLARASFYRVSGLAHRDAANCPPVQSGLTLLKVIWPNTFRQGFVSLSQYVMTWSPVLIASSFLGLRAAATVGLTVQIIGLIKVFGNALYNAYLPQFSSLRLVGDLPRLRFLLALALGVATWVILGVGGLALLIGPAVLDWLGTDVVLLSLAPGLVFLLNEWAVNQYALVSGYLTTANRVLMQNAYLVTAIVGVAGQWLAVSYLDWGIWGIVIPPLVASALYNDWIWFRRAAHELGCSSMGLLANSIAGPIKVAARPGEGD